MRWAVPRQRLIPPIGLGQCYGAVEQSTKVGFCEDSAFVPILKNLSLLQEHDSLYFRRNLVDMVRHQQ